MDVFDLAAKITLDDVEYLQKLRESEEQTTSFGSKVGSVFSKVGSAVVGVLEKGAQAAVSFAKSSVTVGTEFDAAMSKVGSTLEKSVEDIDSLREAAIEWGGKTVFNATQVAEAFNYMAMAGWTDVQAMDGISGVLSLAAASGADLATTSDIVTDAITAMGYSASDSAHFANVLAKAASNANTDVVMMGETFKYAAPVAGSLGYSIEDVAIATGLMANSGIKASQAGTALRSVFSRLATNAGHSAEELGALDILTEKLGVEFYDAEGEARDFNDVLTEAREAWQGLTAAEEQEYAKKIAGMYGESGWLAMMNAEAADVEKLTNAVYNATDAAENMMEIRSDNLQGDLTALGSAIETAKVRISDGLTPTLREFVQFGTDGVRSLTSAFETGGFMGVADALGGVLSDGIQLILDKLPEVMQAGVRILSALIKGINENIGQITDAATEVIMILAEGILDNLPAILKGAVQIITSLAKGLAKNIPILMPKITEVILEIVEMLIDNADELLDAALALIEALAKGLIDSLPKILDKLPELIAKIVAFLVEAMPELQIVGMELFSALIDLLPDIIDFIITIVPEILTAIVDEFSKPETQQKMKETGEKLLTAIVENSTQIVETILLIVPKIISGMVDALFNRKGEMEDAGEDTMLGFLGGIQGKVQWFIDQCHEIFGKIVQSIKDFFGINSPSKMFEGFGGNLIQGLWNGISNAKDWLMDKIGGFFGNVVDNIKSFFGISSPSKLFAKLGGFMAEGLGIGFGDEMEDVTKDMIAAVPTSFDAGTSLTTSAMSSYSAAPAYSYAQPAESQPVNIILTIDGNVELGRWLISNINEAKRVDGIAY